MVSIEVIHPQRRCEGEFMGDFDAVDPAVLELGLPELFLRAAARWPDRVAAAFPAERLSYGELERRARDVGARLVAAGVGPGDHVGLLIPNSGRFLATLLGISLCGAVPVPLNTRFRGDELPYVIEHADLVGLVTVGEAEVNPRGEPVDYPARLAEALPSLGGDPFCAEAPRLRFVAAYGPSRHPWLTAWAGPAAGTLDPVPAGGTALLLYTSGTTSRPKGVHVTHHALVVTGVVAMVGRMGMTADDVVWSPAPLCHIGAYVALVGAFATGATFVTAPYFAAAAAVELLDRERVTIAYAGFPAFYLDLAQRLRETGGELAHLRVLTTAAAPGEIERVRAGFPRTLQVSVTGSTELSGMICVNHATDTAEQRATTAGLPLEGIEVSIRDAGGAAVGPGGTGEIWVRGYCLLAAYHRDPRPVVTGDPDPGWYRTGDLGALVDGRLSFRGRLKDMVKVGGENVAAAEVEGFLLRHPAVALVQVVAGPDPRLGEVPVAFVEVAPGCALTEAELIEFCRGAMAAYKVPRAVHFLTEWPTSATKISKPALRARLTG
jgi:acyl-CoA synthetase (AMP-forming)/AMP-acid ligase II